jgi:hypothetical protein
MDDEGWQSDPWGSDPTAAPGDVPQAPPPPRTAPDGPDAGPPPTAPTSTFAGPPPSNRNTKIAVAVVAAIIVIGAGIGVAAAVHHGPTTTTTSQANNNNNNNTSTTSGPNTTTAPSSGLLSSVSPSVFSNCQDLASGQRGIPNAVDQVACTGSDLNSDGAVAAFFAQLPSASAAQAYIQTDLGSTATTSSGDCSSLTLGSGEALCNFSDQNGNAGVALLAIGSAFSYGPGATVGGDCAVLGQSASSGVSVLVWAYSGSDVVGGLESCSEDTSALSTMRSTLLGGDLALSN